MNYKPTDEEIIAYLYGELEGDKASLLEKYLEQNPEEKKRLEEMNETRLIFNQLEDVELPEPMAFINTETNSEWQYWRRYVAVAATLLLVITFGWISGFNFAYSENGLQLGFGEINNGLTEEEVADIIYADRMELIDIMSQNTLAVSDSLNEKFDALEASMNSGEIIKQIFDREKETLVNQMISLNDKLSEDNRDVLRQIVVSFSNNFQNQRIEDLRNIQAAFSELEEATINKQFDMETALEELSAKVDAVASNNPNNN